MMAPANYLQLIMSNGPLQIGEYTQPPERRPSSERSNKLKGDCLPLFPYGYEETKQAGSRVNAVDIYRMLFRFFEVCERNKCTIDLKKSLSPEGSTTAPQGLDYQRSSEQELPNFSFRLITALRKLFSLLRTPTILSLQSQVAQCDGHFDWRQIERQLHRAMYLPDGSPLFDGMDALRPVLRDQTADIVGMACWVARDASVQFLGEDLQSIAGSGLAREWETLANDFAERHLHRFQSLFSDSTGKACRELRHVLHQIDQRTPFKSHRYFDISELLETILSYHVIGDGGDVWAMKGFAYAWEAICLDHAIDFFGRQQGCEIFTCDVEYLDRTVIDENSLESWHTNRKDVFSRNARDRRPDLVIKDVERDSWRVIDFKYYSESELPTKQQLRPSHKNYQFYKPAQDLDNLEVYGLLLATSRHSVDLKKITYEIWIPGAKASSSAWVFGPCNKSKWCIDIVRMETPKLVNAYGKKFRIWE